MVESIPLTALADFKLFDQLTSLHRRSDMVAQAKIFSDSIVENLWSLQANERPWNVSPGALSMLNFASQSLSMLMVGIIR